jgi:hypothetical protein
MTSVLERPIESQLEQDETLQLVYAFLDRKSGKYSVGYAIPFIEPHLLTLTSEKEAEECLRFEDCWEDGSEGIEIKKISLKTAIYEAETQEPDKKKGYFPIGVLVIDDLLGFINSGYRLGCKVITIERKI